MEVNHIEWHELEPSAPQTIHASALLEVRHVEDKEGRASDFNLHWVRHIHFARLDHRWQRCYLLGTSVTLRPDDLQHLLDLAVRHARKDGRVLPAEKTACAHEVSDAEGGLGRRLGRPGRLVDG